MIWTTFESERPRLANISETGLAGSVDFPGLSGTRSTRARKSAYLIPATLFGLSDSDTPAPDRGCCGTLDVRSILSTLLYGTPVAGGVIGKHPSLTDLDNGDLKFATDFRTIYAGIAQNWMEVDPARVVGEEFKPLSFLS